MLLSSLSIEIKQGADLIDVGSEQCLQEAVSSCQCFAYSILTRKELAKQFEQKGGEITSELFDLKRPHVIGQTQSGLHYYYISLIKQYTIMKN